MKIFNKNVFFILLAATLVCSYFHTHNIFASQQPQNQKTKPIIKAKKKKVIPAYTGFNKLPKNALEKIASCLGLTDYICFFRTNKHIHDALKILILNCKGDNQRFSTDNKKYHVYHIAYYAAESSFEEPFGDVFPNLKTLIIDKFSKKIMGGKIIIPNQALKLNIAKLKNLEKVVIKNSDNYPDIFITDCPTLKNIILEDSSRISAFQCHNCSALKKIIHNNINYTKNGRFSLSHCNNLESIFINNCETGNNFLIDTCSTLKKIAIDDTEFYGLICVENCNQLKEIAIAKSTIRDFLGDSAIEKCTKDLNMEAYSDFLILDKLCRNIETICLNDVKNKSKIQKTIALPNVLECLSNLTLEVDGKEDLARNRETVSVNLNFSSIDPFEHQK